LTFDFFSNLNTNIVSNTIAMIAMIMTNILPHPFPDTKSPIFEINQIIDNSNRSYL